MFFAVLSCCLGMEAQRAAPHNNVSHNSITINNIPNVFIVLFVVFSCRFGMEAQHAAPLLAFPQLNGELNPHVIRPYKFSILNSFHLSIELALRL